MNTRKNTIRLAIVAATLMLFAAACSDPQPEPTPSAQETEAERRQENLDRLADAQPAGTMGFSPTRETVNFWMETWDEQGKLAYVYLSGADGNLIGYYVLEGLPVSYCVGITQPYDIVRLDGQNNGKGGESDNFDAVVAAPGMDGAYYGGCNDRTFYGKDATTGAYIEYTVGVGQNVFLYDQPLPRQDVQPIGYTVIEEDGSLSESSGPVG